MVEGTYLAYWEGTVKDSGYCGRNDLRYFARDSDQVKRVLKYDWKRVRRLGTENYYHLLYCFNGFGLNSMKIIDRNVSEEPNADNECKGFYDSKSEFSLEKLKELNSK